MAEVAHFGMQDLGEDFRALDEAWPGAIEIGVPVGEVDVVVAHGAQLLPDGVADERPHLASRHLDVVAARCNEDHVRIAGGDFLPGDPWRRLARSAEQADAAGDVDQLRHPVPAGHRRIHPLDEGELLLRPPGDLGGDGGEAVLHRGDEFLAGLGTADGFGDAGDVGVDVGERVRAHRHDARLPVHELAHGALHVGERHGAHFALVLREDDVRLELFQRFGVDVVDREPVLDQRAHGLVDIGARPFDAELRAGDRRQLQHRGRVIAFVRARDLQIAGAERVQYLGCAGDERDDARVGRELLCHDDVIAPWNRRCKQRQTRSGAGDTGRRQVGEVGVQGGDDLRTFADGCCHPLDGTGANVADGEHTCDVRFQSLTV